MTLCINQSGTWINIPKICINQSGTWRNLVTGCINQSGTWRKFFPSTPALGSLYQGGYVFCITTGPNVIWMVAPYAAEVVPGDWADRNTANSCAQTVTGYSGWFVPSLTQMATSHACKIYWDYIRPPFFNPYGEYGSWYWTNTGYNIDDAYDWNMNCPTTSGAGHIMFKSAGTGSVRSFRTVSY